MCEFEKNLGGGVLFWRPFMRDPVMLGPYEVPLISCWVWYGLLVWNFGTEPKKELVGRLALATRALFIGSPRSISKGRVVILVLRGKGTSSWGQYHKLRRLDWSTERLMGLPSNPTCSLPDWPCIQVAAIVVSSVISPVTRSYKVP